MAFSLFTIFPLHFAILFILGIVQHTQAVIRQVIVDDTDVAVQYSDIGWSRGNSCTSCAAALNLNFVHGGTWMNATSRFEGLRVQPDIFFTFNFTGLSIDIRTIVQRIEVVDSFGHSQIVQNSINVTIDGVLQGRPAIASQTGPPQYDQSIFKKRWPVNGQHSLRVDLDTEFSPFQTLLLDYLIYEADIPDGQSAPSVSAAPSVSSHTTGTPLTAETGTTSNTSSSTSPNAGVIIGGAIMASAVVLLLGGAMIWWLMRRKQRAQRPRDFFDIDPPGYPVETPLQAQPWTKVPPQSVAVVRGPSVSVSYRSAGAVTRTTSLVTSSGLGLDTGSLPPTVPEPQSPSSDPIMSPRSIMSGMTAPPAYSNTPAPVFARSELPHVPLPPSHLVHQGRQRI